MSSLDEILFRFCSITRNIVSLIADKAQYCCTFSRLDTINMFILINAILYRFLSWLYYRVLVSILHFISLT